MIQSKGEALVTLVVGETLIDPNELMSNQDFVKEAKRLIKEKSGVVLMPENDNYKPIWIKES